MKDVGARFSRFNGSELLSDRTKDNWHFPARSVLILSVLLSFFGLWTSLHYVFSVWGTDADAADPIMLWYGVRQHGLSFLTTWYYTQDNWLLSLVPLDFLQYFIIGAKPFLVVVSGWLVFVGCVFVSVIMAKRLVGAWSFIVLAPFFLLCNRAVVGWPDFLGYSCTHNISLFWGVLAMLLSARWIVSGGWALPPTILVLLVVNGVSDPWSKAAFLVPILIGALICLVTNNAVRWRLAALVGVALVAIFLCWTKLFGVFAFLPKDQLGVPSWPQANANASALISTFGQMFRPFPGLTGDWAITNAMTCVALGVLTWIALTKILRRWRELDPGQFFILAVALLSLGGVTSAFLVGTFQDLTVTGRFFLNAYVFLPIIICAGVGLAGSEARGFRAAAGVLACLVMISGAASDPAAWLCPSLKVDTKGTVALAAFLQKNALFWGYGDYNGTGSSAVSWISHGSVLIRPVTFNQITGQISPRTGQTSPLWYGPAEPRKTAASFVIITSTPGSCQVAEVCLSGITKQFGPPVKRLVYGTMSVLIWNRPLLLSGLP